MLTRIVSDPAILAGKACIKGTRILNFAAQSLSNETIVTAEILNRSR